MHSVRAHMQLHRTPEPLQVTICEIAYCLHPWGAAVPLPENIRPFSRCQTDRKMLQDRNLSPGTLILPGNGAQQLNQSRSEPKKITREELMVRTLGSLMHWLS